MTLSINPVPIPTGGVVGVTFTTATSGNITLSRSPYPTISYTTVYTGPPLNARGDNQFILDLGDGTPGPLLPTSQYIYQLTDITGTITSNPLTPVAAINLDIIDFTPLLVNLLQGAVNSVQLPNGVKRPRVVHAMPLTGLLPMPFIVLAPELEQQEETPIGQSNVILDEGFLEPPWHNVSTQTALESNMYRITVFSTNASERDYYRRLIIGTFRANLGYVFQQIGEDIVHRYQAASFQKPQEGMEPGFYGCDVMLEFTGTSNVTIYTNYGIIEHIETFSTINSLDETITITPENITVVIDDEDQPGAPVDETEVPHL